MRSIWINREFFCFFKKKNLFLEGMNEKKEAMDVLSGMRGISIRLGANIVLLASFRSFFFTNGKFLF